MSQIEIPNDALRYILFQRTGLLWHPKIFPLRVLSKLDVAYKTLVILESILRKRQIKCDFNSLMFLEYRSIRDYLPSNARNVLDIGCGIAAIDIFIDRHYKSSKDLLFHLLDKTQIDDNLLYGFNQSGAFYNSLDMAKHLLMENGIEPGRIKLYEVSNDAKPDINQEFDIVISLISWGFHYPVDVYLDQVYQLMRHDGHLILDIRRDTNGEDKIRKYWRITLNIKGFWQLKNNSECIGRCEVCYSERVGTTIG
jgi:SAM-dependent methyltransferase